MSSAIGTAQHSTAQHSTAQHTERYDCIQVLRAIAALAVVGQHIPGLDRGAWGVDLFFIISGFIVCHVTQDSADGFLLKRLIRVVPLYWAGTLAVFGLAALAPGLMNSTTANPEHLVKSLLFIPFAKGDLVRPVLFLGWTLNYEMFFYAVFFVAMKISHRDRALLCSLALTALTLVGTVVPSSNVVLHFFSNPLILEFVLGMECFYLVRWGMAAQADRPPRTGRTLLGITVLLACLYLAPAQDNTFERVVRWGLPALVVFLVTLWGFGTLRLSPRWTLLGDASYSLYLFHPYILQAFDKKLHAFDPSHGVRRWLMMAVAPMLCGAFAVALYRWVEQPTTAALRRGCFGPRAGTPAVALSKA